MKRARPCYNSPVPAAFGHEVGKARGLDGGAAGGLIFVSYRDGDDPHLSLVRNVADPETAEVITVHALDETTNRTVMRSMPTRTTWRYTVATGELQRWTP